MNEMRLISLCIVHYKIISKVLCERLKKFLSTIISETHGAFISECSITDNILVVHELIHALKTKEDIAEEYMVIKTYMPKAFDRVE